MYIVTWGDVLDGKCGIGVSSKRDCSSREGNLGISIPFTPSSSSGRSFGHHMHPSAQCCPRRSQCMEEMQPEHLSCDGDITKLLQYCGTLFAPDAPFIFGCCTNGSSRSCSRSSQSSSRREIIIIIFSP